MATLTVFVPLRVSSSDAITLETAARSQQLTRSAVLRTLIRSIDTATKQEAAQRV